MLTRVFVALLVVSALYSAIYLLYTESLPELHLKLQDMRFALSVDSLTTPEVLSSTDENEAQTIEEEEFRAATNSVGEARIEEKGEDLETFFKEREKEYERRRQRVRQVCKASGEKLRNKNRSEIDYGHLSWLNDRKLVMCLNAKVGSTTWSRYLVHAANPAIELGTRGMAAELLHPPCHPKNPDIHGFLNSYTKVVTVRHPFSRLMSAYFGKITTNRVKNSISHLRQVVFGSRYDKSWISFESFARYLVLTTPVDDDISIKRDGKTNAHWFSFYANCDVCDIDYDIIVKKETLDGDLRYLSHHFNLNVTIDTIFNQGRKPTEEVAYRIFKKLPRNLTLALYERYRPDFELFGYTIDDYLAEE